MTTRIVYRAMNARCLAARSLDRFDNALGARR